MAQKWQMVTNGALHTLSALDFWFTNTHLALLISEELKVNLTLCTLPDFTLFILAELLFCLIYGTKLTLGMKQNLFQHHNILLNYTIKVTLMAGRTFAISAYFLD